MLRGDLRAALVDAGATEELATMAMADVATDEARPAGIDSRLSLLTSMVGATLALSTTILVRVFHCHKRSFAV